MNDKEIELLQENFSVQLTDYGRECEIRGDKREFADYLIKEEFSFEVTDGDVWVTKEELKNLCKYLKEQGW